MKLGATQQGKEGEKEREEEGFSNPTGSLPQLSVLGQVGTESEASSGSLMFMPSSAAFLRPLTESWTGSVGSGADRT